MTDLTRNMMMFVESLDDDDDEKLYKGYEYGRYLRDKNGSVRSDKSNGT